MTNTPNHRRGAAVTEHLLNTALDLVLERRTVMMSIDEIAERAGVNKTTVYRRWPDVPSLIRDAVLARAETSIPLETTGDQRADLVRFCCDVVDNLESPTGRALALASRDLPELDAIRTGFWDTRLRAATTLLADHSSGEEAELAIERLVAPLHFRILERGLPVTPSSIDDLVDHFLRGLDQP